MEFENELTFDMIGNMSDEEIINANNKDKEVIEDEDLFPSSEEEEDNPEGVDDNNQENQEDTVIDDNDGSSPNFYASIANSLRNDGILTLDDDDFKNVQNADDLAILFKKQTESLLEEQHKRINEALNTDVPVDVIKQYENVIAYVNSISEDDLKDETPEAEQLRGNIICQDYMNRGFSQERANKEVKKSFDAGTDVEDALESLKDVKDFYVDKYNSILTDARTTKENSIKTEKEQSKKIEQKFLDVEEPIKGIKLNENERKKVLTQYTKFIDKDSNGKPLNAIQKYAKDNPVDYQYNINLLYYLTNGFKDMGTVIGKQVKKETKSALSDLEKKLRNPGNHLGGGGLNFDNDSSPDSYSGINVVLD